MIRPTGGLGGVCSLLQARNAQVSDLATDRAWISGTMWKTEYLLLVMSTTAYKVDINPYCVLCI